jgi:hypothetical protein
VARGWESKSIESQQDDVEARSRQKSKPVLTADQQARLHQKGLLELALAGAQAELQAACHPAHRDMLRMKLASLTAQLEALTEPQG